MKTHASMDEAIEQLIKLQEMDRIRDRLQRKLDQVPKRLKGHTDTIAELEQQQEERVALALAARAEADRAELDVKTKEDRRETIKQQMNAPKLSNREYEVLRDEMAGVLADINSLQDVALKSLERAGTADEERGALGEEIETRTADYEKLKAELEGSVSDVKADVEKRIAARAEFISTISMEPLAVYERVRRKHADALALVEGNVDRAANRMGDDLHCSACYITITPNDAVNVMARAKIVQCRSCVRILYVP